MCANFVNDQQSVNGSNIISVMNRVKHASWLFEKLPQYSYDNIQPDKFYPMKQFTLLVDYFEENTSANVLRNIGQDVIPELKKAGVLPDMSPAEFIKGLSSVYHAANRGPDIGDWKVIKEEKDHIILENTTVHNCMLEEGILLGGIAAYGGKFGRIKQTKCVRNGDPACIFDVTWKTT